MKSEKLNFSETMELIVKTMEEGFGIKDVQVTDIPETRVDPAEYSVDYQFVGEEQKIATKNLTLKGVAYHDSDDIYGLGMDNENVPEMEFLLLGKGFEFAPEIILEADDNGESYIVVSIPSKILEKEDMYEQVCIAAEAGLEAAHDDAQDAKMEQKRDERASQNTGRNPSPR